MNRVAAMTVIRGSGACQAFYNGMVQQELRRQMALTEEAEYRAQQMEQRRNEQLEKRLVWIHDQIFGRRGCLKRLCRGVENAWAMVWAITAGKCWIEIGERLGLWEAINDEDQR